jgi:hypothetical protein
MARAILGGERQFTNGSACGIPGGAVNPASGLLPPVGVAEPGFQNNLCGEVVDGVFPEASSRFSGAIPIPGFCFSGAQPLVYHSYFDPEAAVQSAPEFAGAATKITFAAIHIEGKSHQKERWRPGFYNGLHLIPVGLAIPGLEHV